MATKQHNYRNKTAAISTFIISVTRR